MIMYTGVSYCKGGNTTLLWSVFIYVPVSHWHCKLCEMVRIKGYLLKKKRNLIAFNISRSKKQKTEAVIEGLIHSLMSLWR